MDTIKKAATLSLGVAAFGLMIFSFATIGLAVLGITVVLVMVGLLAKPFSHKRPQQPITINVTPISSKFV